jgi:predicted RNA-binding protein
MRMSAAEVVGVDVRGESVLTVVGQSDRLVFVTEADHREHRPEDLVLGEIAGVVDVTERRGLDKVAAR